MRMKRKILSEEKGKMLWFYFLRHFRVRCDTDIAILTTSSKYRGLLMTGHFALLRTSKKGQFALILRKRVAQ